MARRQRDHDQREKAQIGGKTRVIRRDPIEYAALEPDQVELVDREHDMPDAEQGADQGMSPGLGQDALARVDQQHRQIGGRGAARHVARVLLVPGAVGDNERAPRGRKKPIGDIDGDALLAFVLQPIEQQREIDILAGRAKAPRLLFQRGELVAHDQVGIVEQAPDQRRFAVIDRAAGKKAQKAPVGRRRHLGPPIRHQK